MKFIYTGGTRQFRGYFFWDGKPVDVTDRGTLAVIHKERGFVMVEDEKVEEPKTPETPALGCPRCGKVFPRGQHLHDRHCKA